MRLLTSSSSDYDQRVMLEDLPSTWPPLSLGKLNQFLERAAITDHSVPYQYPITGDTSRTPPGCPDYLAANATWDG